MPKAAMTIFCSQGLRIASRDELADANDASLQGLFLCNGSREEPICDADQLVLARVLTNPIVALQDKSRFAITRLVAT